MNTLKNYELKSIVMWVVFCIALFLMPLYIDKTSGPGEMHPLSIKIMYNGMMFAFLGVVAYFLGLFSTRRWTYVDKAATGFIAFIILSLLWTTYVNYTLYELVLLFASVVAYRFTLLFSHEKYQRDAILWALFMGGVCVAALGVYDHWTPGRHLDNPTHVGSLFGNKNMATHYLVLTFPLSIYLFFQKRSDLRVDAVIALGWLLMALHLFYAQTRSAWVALFFMLLIGFLCLRSKQLKSLVGYVKSIFSIQRANIVLMAIVAFGVFINYSEFGFQWFFEYGEGPKEPLASSSARFEVWRGVVDKVLERPVLGWGLGSYEHWRFLHNEYGLQVLRLHNEYLQLLYEIGIVGCTVFLTLVVAVGRGIYNSLVRSNLDVDSKLLIFSLMLAFVGTGAQSAFTFPYQLMVPAIVLAVYMALVSVSVRNNDESHAGTDVSMRSQNGMQEHVLFVVAVVVFIINLQWFRDSGDMDDLLYKTNASDEFAYGRKKWVDDVFHEVLAPQLPTINQRHSVIRMQRILEQNPSNIFAYRTLALSHRILEEPEKAEDMYKKMLEQTLQTGVYQRFSIPYVLYLIQNKRVEEAQEVFKKLKQRTGQLLEPGQDLFWEDAYAMGEGAMMVGEPELAIRYLNKTIDGNENVADMKVIFASTLANAYRRSGDLVMARKWYKVTLQKHPSHPQRQAIVDFLDKTKSSEGM